jgi:hypothetical protein
MPWCMHIRHSFEFFFRAHTLLSRGPPSPLEGPSLLCHTHPPTTRRATTTLPPSSSPIPASRVRKANSAPVLLPPPPGFEDDTVDISPVPRPRSPRDPPHHLTPHHHTVQRSVSAASLSVTSPGTPPSPAPRQSPKPVPRQVSRPSLSVPSEAPTQRPCCSDQKVAAVLTERDGLVESLRSTVATHPHIVGLREITADSSLASTPPASDDGSRNGGDISLVNERAVGGGSRARVVGVSHPDFLNHAPGVAKQTTTPLTNTCSAPASRQNPGEQRPLYIWEAPGTPQRVLEDRRDELLRLNLKRNQALRTEWRALQVAMAHGGGGGGCSGGEGADAGERTNSDAADARPSARVTASVMAADPPRRALGAAKGQRAARSPKLRTVGPAATHDPDRPLPHNKRGRGRSPEPAVHDDLGAPPPLHGGGIGGGGGAPPPLYGGGIGGGGGIALLDDVVDFSDVSWEDSYANLASHAVAVSRSTSTTSTATTTTTSTSPPASPVSAPPVRRISRPAPPPPDYTRHDYNVQPAPLAPHDYRLTAAAAAQPTTIAVGDCAFVNVVSSFAPARSAPTARVCTDAPVEWTEHRAAVTIQARWRGHTVRKRTALMQRRQIPGQPPSRAYVHALRAQAFFASHPTGQPQFTSRVLPVERNHRQHQHHNRGVTTTDIVVDPRFTPAAAPASAPRRPMAVPAVPQAVPPGWSATVDPASGRPYYINLVNGATQWTHPTCPDVLLSPPPRTPTFSSFPNFT